MKRVRPKRTSFLLEPKQIVSSGMNKSKCPVNKFVDFITYRTSMVAPKCSSRSSHLDKIDANQKHHDCLDSNHYESSGGYLHLRSSHSCHLIAEAHDMCDKINKFLLDVSDADNEDDDCDKPKQLTSPYSPTEDEIREHETTHIPFRAWCPSCVQGQAVNDPHFRRKLKDRYSKPQISIDYSFLSTSGQEEPGCMPTLNIRDKISGKVMSHVVPRKGNHSFAVDCLRMFIEDCGYKSFVLKSDQEPAIMSLKERLRDETDYQITFEQSPVGDSSSNGDIESSIRRTTALARTLKLCLESYLKESIEGDWHIVPWIIHHASNLISWFRRDAFGRTSYEHIHGKKFIRKLPIIGESIFALLADSKGENKLDSRWISGIFLGLLESSLEYLIGTPHGVIKVRTIRRKPELKDRWSLLDVKNIRGTPWEPYPGDGLTMRGLRPKVPVDKEQSIPAHPQPASFKGRKLGFAIRKDDIAKYGATAGCRGCIQLKRGGYGHHSPECRVRLEKLLRDDGDPRIHTYDARFEEELKRAFEEDHKRAEKHKDVPESSGDVIEPNEKKMKTCAPSSSTSSNRDKNEDFDPFGDLSDDDAEQPNKRLKEVIDSQDEPSAKRPRSLSELSNRGIVYTIHLSEITYFADETFEYIATNKPIFVNFIGASSGVISNKVKLNKLHKNINSLINMQINESRHFLISAVREDPLWRNSQLRHVLNKSPCVSNKHRSICSSSTITIDLIENNPGNLDTIIADSIISQCQADRIDFTGNLFMTTAFEDSHLDVIYDDVSGKLLDEELVGAARQEEIAEIKKSNLYTKVPLEECIKNTGKKPISTRWVDINKGDEIHPEYRSRLVGRELKFRDPKRDDLFAATPPLEAKNMLLSLAVTENIGYNRGKESSGMQLEFIDIRRAYYQAHARRRIYVQLPPEDDEPGKCGLLNKALQGTRDAAQCWEYEYTTFMESIGFVRGIASPCMFFHPNRHLRSVIHGDDFTLLGFTSDLDWFRHKITSKWDVKLKGRIGPGPQDLKVMHVLNRIVEWTPSGIKYEADSRHAEIIIDTLGLNTKTKGSPIPGSRLEYNNTDQEMLLGSRDATMYRALVARANYLAQDRLDIAFATKELSIGMPSPKLSDWNQLKRLGRYLILYPRAVLTFAYQKSPGAITGISDTDWAGCKKTRKSTSGGIITFGNHILKSYSTTQALVNLSSGEAEFYGLVKAGSTCLGIQSMLKDFGIACGIYLHLDASAAKGIAQRVGLGKLRHLEVSQLWIQHKVASGSIIIRKVPGQDNIADALTKYLAGPDLERHVKNAGLDRRSDFHPEALRA